MDRQKFESIVQTYGADTERWPHAHRADMLALLDTDPQARAILGQEAALDSLLGAMEPPVSDTLEARIRNDMAATLGAQSGLGASVQAPCHIIRGTTLATGGGGFCGCVGGLRDAGHCHHAGYYGSRFR